MAGKFFGAHVPQWRNPWAKKTKKKSDAASESLGGVGRFVQLDRTTNSAQTSGAAGRLEESSQQIPKESSLLSREGGNTVANSRQLSRVAQSQLSRVAQSQLSEIGTGEHHRATYTDIIANVIDKDLAERDPGELRVSFVQSFIQCQCRDHEFVNMDHC